MTDATGVEIRMLADEDADLLAHVDPDVFDHPIIPEMAAAFAQDPRHHLAVALDRGRIVGMASAVDYIHPDKTAQLWINEVGVAASQQRRGIGRRLLHTLLEHGRTLGCREAWVGTEADNEAARALYASIGGEEAPFVMVSFALGGTNGD